MRNKTGHGHWLEQINRGKTHSLQKVYETTVSSNPNRIFEVPAFMFARKDQANQIDKANVETINAFRPRLEIKQNRQPSLGSKKVKGKQMGSQRIQQARKRMQEKRTIQKRLNKIIQQELNHFRQGRRAYISIDSEELKRQIKADQFGSRSIDNNEEEMSPYAKYSVNAFPKKELRSLNTKQKSINARKDDLGMKLKCSIRQKIQEIQSKFAVVQPKMMEVMTIYSIKQQTQPQHQSKSHFAVSFFKKKQRYQLPERSLGGNQSIRDINDVEEIKQDGKSDKTYHRKIYSYFSFLLRVNFSNGIPIRNAVLCQRPPHTKAKVFVGNGNNRWLLIALLKRRFWLELTPKLTADTNFVWTQNSIREVHNSQKPYAQYLLEETQRGERRKESEQASKPPKPTIRIKINTMKKLNPEMMENTNQEETIVVKSSTLLKNTLTQDIPLVQSEVIRPKLKIRAKDQLHLQNNKKIFLCEAKGNRADRLLQRFKITIKKELEPNWDNIYITNHVPHNSFISSKKALFYTMEHYYRHIKRIDPFTVIPRTYHFKSPEDESFTRFLQNQKQTDQHSIWIVKPGECTNRGNGISILRAEEVTRKLLKRQTHPNGQPKTTIVQSYITDPLLYHGRKFDLRHYMLVTITRGVLKAYWYSQGYVRTSSELFTLHDLTNPFVHLTNDAVQQNSANYGKYELGNKLSYQQLQRYLDNAYPKLKINFRSDILSKMQEIATDIIRANYRTIDRDRKVSNFQIFGLDFMLDKHMTPWLIEVNANPCLQISCPLLSRVIPMMVQQSLRLALDPLIPPPSHYPPNQRYYLPDDFLNSLRYSLIFDQLQLPQENKKDEEIPQLNYNFTFDQPEDEYQNQGTDLDLGRLLD